MISDVINKSIFGRVANIDIFIITGKI